MEKWLPRDIPKAFDHRNQQECVSLTAMTHDKFVGIINHMDLVKSIQSSYFQTLLSKGFCVNVSYDKDFATVSIFLLSKKSCTKIFCLKFCYRNVLIIS